MKAFLRVLMWLVGVGIGGIGLLVGIGMFMNSRAESAARDLCAALPAGTPEADAVREGESRTWRHFKTDGTHQFVFQGWVFNGVECVLRVEGGKVVATEVRESAD